MTALIKDGYVHEQVISHKEKYISLTGEGKNLFVEYLNKSAALTQKLRFLKKENSNQPVSYPIFSDNCISKCRNIAPRPGQFVRSGV